MSLKAQSKLWIARQIIHDIFDRAPIFDLSYHIKKGRVPVHLDPSYRFIERLWEPWVQIIHDLFRRATHKRDSIVVLIEALLPQVISINEVLDPAPVEAFLAVIALGDGSKKTKAGIEADGWRIAFIDIMLQRVTD